jgi:hypothetical protein
MRNLLLGLACVLLLSGCASGPGKSFALLGAPTEATREDAMRAYAKWYVEKHGYTLQPKSVRMPVQMKTL